MQAEEMAGEIDEVRGYLHELVDDLPAAELASAKRYLQFLRELQDPMLAAMTDAPYDNEGDPSEEEERGVAEAWAEYRAGESSALDQLGRDRGD